MTLNHTRQSRLGLFYFFGVPAAFSIAILLLPRPPLLRDYPDWVYQGMLFAKAVSGHPATHYVIKHYPVPNSLSTVGLGLLTLLVGWKLAAKLWLIVSVASAAFASLRLARALDADTDLTWLLLPGALFFGISFWYGTVNFNLGLCMFLWLAALLVEGCDKRVSLGTLLTLIFFTHMIVYAAAVVLLFAYVRQTKAWRLLPSVVPTLLLGAWYSVARSADKLTDTRLAVSPMWHLLPAIFLCLLMLGIAEWRGRNGLSLIASRILAALGAVLLGGYIFLRPFSSGPGNYSKLGKIWMLCTLKTSVLAGMFGFVNSTDRYGGSQTLAITHVPCYIALVATDLAVMFLLLWKMWNSMREEARNPTRLGFLWDTVSVLLVAGLLTPGNVLGVISADGRILQLGIALVLFLVARSPDLRIKLIAAGCVVLALFSLGQYSVIQRWPNMPGIALSKAGQAGRFPTVRVAIEDGDVQLSEYQALETNDENDWIFPTGLFENRP